MRRRNFVQHTGIGLAGFNLLQPFLSTFGLHQQKNIQRWVTQLATATGTLHKDESAFISDAFHSAVNTINAGFAKKGYAYAGSGYHFYNQPEKYCFYVLEFNHDPSGTLDALIPVLHELPDGKWEHFTTINTFQLEALAKAAVSMDEYPQPLVNILLPVSLRSGTRRSNLLYSKHSTIDIVSVTSKDHGTKTRITVSSTSQTIFKDTFASAHCLTCAVL
jgi:hypothetical protein